MNLDEIYRDQFAVFILTHNRSDNVVTHKTLREIGYKGKIVLILDDTDSSIDQYRTNYPDCEIVIFNKMEASEKFDVCDNFTDMRAVVYARNESFDIAERLGIKYFLELDDDYTRFEFKFDSDFDWNPKKISTGIDEVFKSCLRFFINTNVKTIALSQGGDFIGGPSAWLCHNDGKVAIRRKAMNAFFLSPERRFNFPGRINEDVNAYVNLGTKGDLFFTTNQVTIQQKVTQSNKGGLTDIYLNLGTYVKSFYTVMIQPSCVKISVMGISDRRIHHRINWKKVTPCILRESVRKKYNGEKR